MIAAMTAEDVISEETLDEVFSEEDEIQKATSYSGGQSCRVGGKE